MQKTVQELVNSVKSNIGDRQTGTIGSLSVDSAALNAINTCLIKIAKKKKHIKEFEKWATINVTSSTYLYPMPVLDTLGVAIRVKKILRIVSVRSGEVTGVPLERIHPLRRDTIFPLTNTSRVGRPTIYSCYSNTIELFPFPEDNYTLQMRVITWPVALTINSANSGLGEEFDSVIEEYSTSECFSKLQQHEDAAVWMLKYEKDLEETLGSLNDYPDEEWFPTGTTALIGEMGYTGPTSSYSRAYNPGLGIQ